MKALFLFCVKKVTRPITSQIIPSPSQKRIGNTKGICIKSLLGNFPAETAVLDEKSGPLCEKSDTLHLVDCLLQIVEVSCNLQM